MARLDKAPSRQRVRGKRKGGVTRTPTEHAEQVAFVKWFRLTFPHVMIFAIPNGGARHPAVANKLKAEGVLAGVADLYVPKWRLWIEMKREKGSNWTQEQKEFCDYVTKQCGDSYMIARGCQAGIEAIAELRTKDA